VKNGNTGHIGKRRIYQIKVLSHSADGRVGIKAA